MSTRPPPTKKQMILQQVMLAMVVFLGAQMMCRPQQGPVETRTPEQILGDVNHPESGKAPPAPEVQGGEYDPSKGSIYWANSKLDQTTLLTINKIYQDQLGRERDVELGAFQAQVKKGQADPTTLKQKQKEWDDRIQQEKLRGDILIADAQYKYALTHDDVNFRRFFPDKAQEPDAEIKYKLSHNDTASLRNAFQLLSGYERSLQGTPLWTQEFPIPATAVAPERFPWRQWSGKELYDKLVADLSERNKNDQIYGVFPGYQIIDYLVNLTGAQPGFSYAFAAFLLALCVRIVVFPLVQKQLLWGRKMQLLSPLLKEIRAEFTKDGKVTNQAELQARTMALYSEYGMNPFSGCLPMAIQFPLFITVYQFMLRYQFAFHRGTFLWINPSSSAATHGFFAPTLGDRDYLLIILYGVSMVFSTLLMPVSDPTQIKQQRLMGIGFGLLFTVMMFTGAFPTPAAFVLYWVFTNLLATAQSLRAYRLPIPPLEKVNTKPGGVFPKTPFSTPPQSPRPNGKPTQTIQMPKSTGTPAKHKPKKRK
ncbi:MAG: YidC/Oxa1 family membrane protein insertase [Fimbriimonadales bacterium]